MTYGQLYRYYGSQTAIAAAVGIGQSAVSQWQRNGIPPLRQWQFARITPLKLSKGIKRRLRLLM